VFVLYWKKIVFLSLGLFLFSTSFSVMAIDSNKCDIRKLELTQIQKAQLRFIRMQYKRRVTSSLQYIVNNSRKTDQLSHILMQPKFNDAEAKRYVLNYYMPRMQQDVNELKVQHEFLQILNLQQRRNWINNCLH
jgi:periplasmic protein CpxP/Spy